MSRQAKLRQADYQSVYEKLERRVVALFRVVEVDEKENVCPDVMLIVDVMIKTLHTQTQTHTHTHTHTA